ncbi:MAG: hypothetical protein Q7V01_07385 [Vicinamibacterales bacterium]|nr:hypothetical protein [Vicinamibacterales bacterium]
MRKLKGQKGLSLVEVTIMLLVLMLLTSVLAPSIYDFVIDAQWVKVKEDCEAIGISVARLTRDVGPCLKSNGTLGCTEENRVDILYSDGNANPPVSNGGQFINNNINAGGINWDSYLVDSDTMLDQFVTNGPLYQTPAQKYPVFFPVGPLFGLGWRGGYLAPPIGPDPWGGMYMVNSVFLATASNSPDAGEGQTGRWWERDVFCISPGPDGIYQTPFEGTKAAFQFGTDRAADDWVYIIQGSGR